MEGIKRLWELLVANKELVAFVLAILALGKERLKTIAVALMLEAEKMAKAGIIEGGPEKMKYVLEQLNKMLLHGILPLPLIAYLAQRWYDWATRYCPEN